MSAEIDNKILHSYQLFKAGANREGWFSNADLVQQIKNYAPLFFHFHPDYEILLAFDNSMTHRAKAPDGLDALSNNLNLGDGGKNCHAIRDGWYINTNGIKIIQKMQLENGMQKGIKTILSERNLFTNAQGNALKLQCKDCREKNPRLQRVINNDKCCARYVLSQQPDFLEQKAWLEEECNKLDMSIIYFPKYHCELNFIEIVWGYIKSYHRKTCTYNFNDLEQNLPVTLSQKIPLIFIKKAYRHCFRFMSGYRNGLTGGLLDYAVKKYKSHRSIPGDRIQHLTNEFNCNK